MIRLGLRVAVFLMLGVMVNVAVAWGCVCWSPVGQNASSVKTEDWVAQVPNDWPPVERMRTYRGIGMAKSFRFATFNQHPDYCIQYTLNSGWPKRSMYSESSSAESVLGYPARWPGVSAEPMSFLDGLRIPQSVPFCAFNDGPTAYPRYLPTRIIPMAFAINTVFYAGVGALIVAVFGTLRRRLRTRAGCCTVCGYDLRGNASGMCPECGVEP